MGYPTKGITDVLNNFGHEQYPSNSVDLWCLGYPNEGIGSLIGFGKATQYPSMCQKICYGAQCIFGIP